LTKGTMLPKSSLFVPSWDRGPADAHLKAA
jgi:hypothetical protein